MLLRIHSLDQSRTMMKNNSLFRYSYSYSKSTAISSSAGVISIINNRHWFTGTHSEPRNARLDF
jgi:hypothetical protein